MGVSPMFIVGHWMSMGKFVKSPAMHGCVAGFLFNLTSGIAENCFFPEEMVV